MPSSATLYRAAMLPGNDLGNKTAETQMPNGRGTPLILSLPSNGTLANTRFRIVASGRVQTTANVTFTLNLYFGFSASIASNTLIFSSGAQTVNAKNSNFSVWIDLFWDSTSLVINGNGTGQMDNGPIGAAGLSNPVLNADPNRDSNTFLVSGTSYGFTLTGTFGTTSTGNHAFVDVFDLEQL